VAVVVAAEVPDISTPMNHHFLFDELFLPCDYQCPVKSVRPRQMFIFVLAADLTSFQQLRFIWRIRLKDIRLVLLYAFIGARESRRLDSFPRRKFYV
jgi:hypothetical protein